MSHPANFEFRLYTADDTLNSRQAIANLRSICDQYLAGRYKIEFVDVIKEPDRALEDRIFLTPTLVKLSPSPVERIVGNLSQTSLVLQVLRVEELVV